MIENVWKRGETCACSTHYSRTPSFFANVLMACSITADWLMPSPSASRWRSICAVSLKRILVFFFFLCQIDRVPHVMYNASTCKPPVRYASCVVGGVRVVASSARKNACGGWTALA